MPKQRMYIAESTVDDEQREIIQKRVDHSYIVQGCAGSGKSCLALLKIKMLSEMNAGEFYLIALVRSLVEYLRNELRDNKIPGERVITHREWINGHITDWCGKNFKIPAGQRQINKTPSFLLVDECQDLSMGDIRELKNAVTKQIFFYGDDEQQIMEFSHAPATIAEISRELNLPIYRLRYNYRLPKKVAAFAQEISGGRDLEKHCKNKEGEKPYVIKVVTLEDQISTILDLAEKNHYEDVGILCRTDAKVRTIINLLKNKKADVSGRYDDNGSYGYTNFNSKYKVMNYHQAKGQQFDAVFLLIEDAVEQNLLYVGITRTYHALFILYSKQLPSIFNAIPLDRFRKSLSELDQPLVQV